MSINRRASLQALLALGVTAGPRLAWPSRLAAQLQATGSQRRLIVLWMPGGPSQLDTFDLKPGHNHGGPFQELSTRTPGMRFSEHLPQLAELSEHLALIRSMHTTEGDHSRGTYLLRTGQRPGNPLRYPCLPAALAKELTTGESSTPGYVSILPSTLINPAAFTAGFLGAAREPLTVAQAEASPPGTQAADEDESERDGRPVDLRVDNLFPPPDLAPGRITRRRQFWDALQHSFAAAQRGGPAATHDTVYRRALQLADSELASAFDLTQEPLAVRQRYGNQAFGQGCLMARRLIERGVPVVEVALSDGPGGLSWDSHADNFSTVRRLSSQLDQAWSQLMRDLAASGLLEHTTLCWMGEFGRTPQINDMGGRDHFPNAWSCVLAGAGVAGGAIIGKTSEDGMEVTDRPVSAPQLLATLCRAVGVDPATENFSEDRRPIALVDAEPIDELLS